MYSEFRDGTKIGCGQRKKKYSDQLMASLQKLDIQSSCWCENGEEFVITDDRSVVKAKCQTRTHQQYTDKTGQFSLLCVENIDSEAIN